MRLSCMQYLEDLGSWDVPTLIQQSQTFITITNHWAQVRQAGSWTRMNMGSTTLFNWDNSKWVVDFLPLWVSFDQSTGGKTHCPSMGIWILSSNLSVESIHFPIMLHSLIYSIKIIPQWNASIFDVCLLLHFLHIQWLRRAKWGREENWEAAWCSITSLSDNWGHTHEGQGYLTWSTS